MRVQTTNSTIQRFNAIRWHDSKLVGLCFYKVGEEDWVKLSLQLVDEDGSLSPAEVIFKECVYCQTDINMAAKSMCGDDISSAKCYESSDWKRAVSEPSPYDPIQGGRHFDEYLHFNLSMCPPGGTISILANNFSLEMKTPG